MWAYANVKTRCQKHEVTQLHVYIRIYKYRSLKIGFPCVNSRLVYELNPPCFGWIHIGSALENCLKDCGFLFKVFGRILTRSTLSNNSSSVWRKANWNRRQAWLQVFFPHAFIYFTIIMSSWSGWEVELQQHDLAWG